MSDKTTKQRERSQNQRVIDSYDYLANAASAQDCTGLIPSAPQNAAELQSYEAVYSYRPPKPGKQAADDTRQR